MYQVNVMAPGQDCSYPIIISPNLLSECAPCLSSLEGHTVAVIADEHTGPLYGSTVENALRTAGATPCLFEVPAGETSKSALQYDRIIDFLLESHVTRSDTVIALGGGVIGDLTGYAAATYLRGVPFIQIPTTLLSQVDSSVGGKVALNHPKGKNLLGAFLQPKQVLIDTGTLSTLDDRQIGAGLGEVIKTACISDEDFFSSFEKWQGRKAMLPHLPEIISHCCTFKAGIVRQDPLDHGLRMILNFGHTLAHALENSMGYGTLLHGEAVCIGMVYASRFGQLLGITPEGTDIRISRLLEAYDLPHEMPDNLAPEQLLQVMALDKKASGKILHLVLLDRIGNAVIHPLPFSELSTLLYRSWR